MRLFQRTDKRFLVVKDEKKNFCKTKRAGPLRGLNTSQFQKTNTIIINIILELTSSPITANNLPFTAECIAIFS